MKAAEFDQRSNLCRVCALRCETISPVAVEVTRLKFSTQTKAMGSLSMTPELRSRHDGVAQLIVASAILADVEPWLPARREKCRLPDNASRIGVLAIHEHFFRAARCRPLRQAGRPPLLYRASPRKSPSPFVICRLTWKTTPEGDHSKSETDATPVLLNRHG